MFIRKKKNRSGSISIQIIQKQQGKYVVIKTLGTSNDEEEIDRLYKQALEAIPRLFNQITLFDDPLDLPRVDELNNDDIRVIGPELIFGRIFDHVGFSKIPDQLFKDLVISRITHPGSKLQLSEYLQENNRQDISAGNNKQPDTFNPDLEDISQDVFCNLPYLTGSLMINYDLRVF